MSKVSRREFVSATVALSAVAIGCRDRGSMAAPTLTRSELLELSAVDVVAALKRGDFTAERYGSALLAQCEAGKSLNAFITIEPDRILEAARAADRRRTAGAELGLLHGLPIPIKDSINTKDLPTTAGTLGLRGFRPKEDAPIVRSIVDAGAIVLGKTNMHELSWGWTSNNLAFGPVHNPYDPARIPGGSSGGTAVAVAARMAPLGVAEDTEGSIRVPAAMCGIAGFRPSTGRYPSSGVAPITTLFDQVGPHARTVGDLILFDSVVTGDSSPLPQNGLKGLKLGIARGYYFTDLEPEVERITGEALRKLQDAGIDLVEIQMPDLASLVDLTTGPIEIHDVLITLRQYLQDYQAGVSFDRVMELASADVKASFANNVLPGAKHFVSDATYRTAREVHLPRLRDQFRAQFAASGATALVFPTTMVPPVPIGQDVEVEIRGKMVPFKTAIARNIAPGSVAGLPGLVLPAGLTSGGLPVTLEFDGPTGTDRALLALGVSLERMLGRIPAPRVG